MIPISLGEDFHFNCAFTVTFLYRREKKKRNISIGQVGHGGFFLHFTFLHRPLLKLLFVVYQRWCLTAADIDTVKKKILKKLLMEYFRRIYRKIA